jgi:hypothetical protein
MSDETAKQIFQSVSDRLRLTGSECDEALSLVRFYMYQPNGYWPWPDDYTVLSDRERRIDEAILAEIARAFELNTGGAARAGFDTSRITTAQMRVSTTTVKPRSRGRVRAKAGHRRQ